MNFNRLFTTTLFCACMHIAMVSFAMKQRQRAASVPRTKSVQTAKKDKLLQQLGQATQDYKKAIVLANSKQFCDVGVQAEDPSAAPLHRLDHIDKELKRHKEKDIQRRSFAGAVSLLAGGSALAAFNTQTQEPGLNSFLCITAGASIVSGILCLEPRDYVDRAMVGAAGCLVGFGTVAGSLLSARRGTFSTDTNTKLFVGGVAGFSASAILLVSAVNRLARQSVVDEREG